MMLFIGHQNPEGQAGNAEEQKVLGVAGNK